MAIPQYLAMTAAEMARAAPLPQHPAWMACHFSPYSTGLTNLPASLPPESLLILNDRTPIHGHDPERVCQQLGELLSRFACRGLLVDFQNPPCPESITLAGFLAQHLEFPMGISPEYQIEAPAVFLPPVPTDVKLEDYLSKWGSRESWLEAALEGQDITLTSQGTVSSQTAAGILTMFTPRRPCTVTTAFRTAPRGWYFTPGGRRRTWQR